MFVVKGDIIMIIKNKKKFVKSILLIIGVSVVIILTMTSKSLSHQEITYKTIAVTSGDTLWDIAKNEQKNNIYYKDNDIRDIIINIKSINKLTSSKLEIEQILEIPTY